MQEHFLKGFVGAIPELQELNGVQVAKFIIAANVGPVGKPLQDLDKVFRVAGSSGVGQKTCIPGRLGSDRRQDRRH